MYFTVEVVSQEEYQNYLEEQRSGGSGSSNSSSSGSANDSSAVDPVAAPAPA
jgi:cytochrome c oxidase subunit 2